MRGKRIGWGLSESSRMELDEKRSPKRLALSEVVLATESSDRIREGKAYLLKLLDMFYARRQKFLSVGVPKRSAHFLFVKSRLSWRIKSLQRIWAVWKLAKAITEQEFFYFRWTFSLLNGTRICANESQSRILRRKGFAEDGMNLLISSAITFLTEAFSESKQDSYQGLILN